MEYYIIKCMNQIDGVKSYSVDRYDNYDQAIEYYIKNKGRLRDKAIFITFASSKEI